MCLEESFRGFPNEEVELPHLCAFMNPVGVASSLEHAEKAEVADKVSSSNICRLQLPQELGAFL